MAQPLISVIVPVYKVEQYLPKCVDSILGQTYENLEILLVDDGSPDRCGELCDQYAARDSRVQVIHKENGGLSSARNAGIEKARGEYLGFVDSDDWIEPETYECLMALALKYQAKLVCGGRYDYSEKRQTRKEGMCPDREEVLSGEALLGKMITWDQCDCAAWDKLYHRSLFETIRFPVGKYYEDIAIAYALVEKAGQAAMLPRRIYNYRHRANSITMAPLTERTFHFEEHTEKIYPYLREKHPAIRSQARFLRVRSLRYTVLTAELADPASRKPFGDRVKKSRKALRSHTFFLLSSPLFDRRERLQDLALAWGIYGRIHARCHR